MKSITAIDHNMPCSAYDNMVQSVADNMHKPELWEAYISTAGNPDYTVETQNLWYYMQPQNEHPTFTKMDTQICNGSGKLSAVDAKHRMSSEWHDLYVQRAKVLRWVNEMHLNILQNWFPPQGDVVYITREQMIKFDKDIYDLKTFKMPQYPDNKKRKIDNEQQSSVPRKIRRSARLREKRTNQSSSTKPLEWSDVLTTDFAF